MKWMAMAGLLGLMLAGCTAEEGTTIEIVGVAAPEDDCTFKKDTDVYVGHGDYDPWGFGFGDSSGYFMAVLVNNNLAPTESSEVVVFGDNVRPAANSVMLAGFEVCFVHVDEPVETSTYNTGCDGVSEDLSAFIPSTITIDPAGTALGYAAVLTPDHLQRIFGERFSPGDIGERGIVNESVLGMDYNSNGTLTDDIRFLGPEPPDENNRNEAWGTYPTQPDTLVLVKMRAIGKTQSGNDVESNWISFAITICVGCLTDRCGPLVVTSDCGNGTYEYQGYYVDWVSFEGCFLFQEVPPCASAEPMVCF